MLTKLSQLQQWKSKRFFSSIYYRYKLVHDLALIGKPLSWTSCGSSLIHLPAVSKSCVNCCIILVYAFWSMKGLLICSVGKLGQSFNGILVRYHIRKPPIALIIPISRKRKLPHTVELAWQQLFKKPFEVAKEGTRFQAYHHQGKVQLVRVQRVQWSLKKNHWTSSCAALKDDAARFNLVSF